MVCCAGNSKQFASIDHMSNVTFHENSNGRSCNFYSPESGQKESWDLLIFNVNRLDSANIEHTHGFYRRILIIPFNKTIAEDKQDKSLHKKILQDKAGVLNWIIAGAERVIANEDIFISQECHKFKAKFIKETDSVALFLDDLGYETSDISISYLSNIYAEYRRYCRDDGYRALGKNNFGKRLQALGIKRAKDNHNKDGFRMVKKFKP